MTPASKKVLAYVVREHLAGRWARARCAGDRVSLASLYYNGWLVRRAWRGEGTSSPAHEYQLSEKLAEAIERRRAAA